AGTNNGVQVAGILGSDAALDVDSINYGNEVVGNIAVASNATIRVDQVIGATDPANGADWALTTASGCHLVGTGTLTKIGTGALLLSQNSAAAVAGYPGYRGNVIVNQGPLIK